MCNKLFLRFKKKYPTNLYICKDEAEIASAACILFREQLQKKPNSVLGLATGSSPIPLYKELAKLNKAKTISFIDVKSFNLDEYVNLDKKYSDQSYRYFMDENLFGKINILKANTFFPDGKNPEKYDSDIKEAGGIDLQVLGLGVNGHIGFNEPGTKLSSITHIVKLTNSTREANARFFDDNPDNVPTHAVSMGLKSILGAKKIVLIATGRKKADAIAKLFENKYDPKWPCTALIFHPDVTVYVDYAAAGKIDKKLED